MTWIAHGLRIESDLALSSVEVDSDGADPDLEIRIVDELPMVGDDQELVLSYEFDDGSTVRAAADRDGSTLVTISSLARFRISPTHDRIDVAVTDPSDLPMASILVQGWVMSMTLMLRGETVFHATAVESSNRCMAFLADSGSGKSTVAAMSIRDGAELVSDDVLRVGRVENGPFVAYPGITAVRLRAPAAELVSSIGPRARSITGTNDDRVAVSFDRTSAEPIVLDAVFIPFPDRDADEVEVEWLRPGVATVELNSYPRVFDWLVSAPVRRHFELSSELATEVPVGLLRVPWGPPWPTNILGPLLDLLERKSAGRKESRA